MSRVAVVGAGYVGLTTAVCFAHIGHDVTCGDIDSHRVAQLQAGEVPILEAGLPEMLQEGVRSERLRFVVGAATAAAGAEFVYLCVPTPQADDGRADLSFIEAAALEIRTVLDAGAVVVNKSTVPVGSTKVVERVLGRPDVHVVSNPEFLREGSAVHDFLHPDRIVIGSEDQAAAIRVASLYLGIAAPLIVTDPASAEVIKYAANAFLATKVSFVNAVAAVCEAVGADVNDVVLGIGYDKRIGQEFLKPGPGWGGSCLAAWETVLVRRADGVTLTDLASLFAQVEHFGASGWEVLAWSPDELRPFFAPVRAFSATPSRGPLVRVTTKMGRRITVTADHPFVVADSASSFDMALKTAGDLTTEDWLPIALEQPVIDPPPTRLSLLSALPAAGLVPSQVIVRMWPLTERAARARSQNLPPARRWDFRRTGALRLSELNELGIKDPQGDLGTVTNGTYVPTQIQTSELFWRVIGLYLAEGFVTSDGDRTRVIWTLHPTGEPDLVSDLEFFWRSLGVKVSTYLASTAMHISISSRILAAWFTDVLRLGRDAYSKRLPDLAWGLGEVHQWALLRGLWDGDGSWSLVNGGPSVVLEYGTASRELADGMLRLLAGLGVVARLKTGRYAKNTVDIHRLTISGAEQVLRAAHWLFSTEEEDRIAAHVGQQRKRIAPTGYRVPGKGTAWVRLARVDEVPYEGPVYSVEVPGAHTVVTSFGLVVHNCLPKDTSALVRIAEDAGYDFDLLRGVISVNDEQRARVVSKIRRAAGGTLSGATVAVWGLTFKARTNDLRASPSLAICTELVAAGSRVRAYDPTVSLERPLGDVEVCADAYAACEGADVLVVLTEWDELRWLDPERVGAALANRAVVDARNLLDRNAYVRAGFAYHGIGR